MAKRNRRTIMSVVAVLGVALGGWMVLSASDTETVQQPVGLSVNADQFLNEVGKGGPPGGGCCDPALEPGQGGNPFCFEGHTCCASGNWQCNNPDGSPSCSPGTVCQGCAGSGGACNSNDDCCSGKCKGNGTCR